MKKIIFLTVLIFFLYSPYSMANDTTEIIPQDKPPTIMELAFLRSLGQTILEIMTEHGDQQLFTAGRKG